MPGLSSVDLSVDTAVPPGGLDYQVHNAWERPGFLLWHSTLRWQRLVAAALQPLGLTHAQFLFLGSTWYLEGSGSAPSQRELAAHTGTDPMMTSQVVRALDARRLILRSADDRDRRIIRVRLTAGGTELAERAVEVVEEVDDDFFADGGAKDTVVGLLRLLARRSRDGTVIDGR